MLLTSAAEARYAERAGIRVKRLQEADKGNIWAADDPERVAKRLAHVRTTERAVTASTLMLTEHVPPLDEIDADTLVAQLAQERAIGRDDLVTPQFLRLALAAAHCVGRITVRGPSGVLLGYGTGMLVGPSILLTNHHVLERAADAAQSEVTFGFEASTTLVSEERVFRLTPQKLFITDEALDFTFVAVSPTDSRGVPGTDLGYICLNPQEGKAINGEFVNVIQHPNGGPKMFALRENRIVDVLTNYLHYVADTAPGSSGAPVFNDQFEMVALHHSGVPERDSQGRILNRDGQPWTSDQGEARVQWKANEGVRVSVLVERAKELARTIEEQAQLAQALDLSRAVPQLEAADPSQQTASDAVASAQRPSIKGDVATWTIPLSVSVSLSGIFNREGPSGSTALPAMTPALPSRTSALSPEMSPELMRAVGRARDVFRTIPGLLLVRAGWQFTDGWITDQAVIVAIVEEKKTTASLLEQGLPKLPSTFDGFPVDVRQASAEEFYELSRLNGSEAFTERTANPTYKKPPHLSLPRVKEHMKVSVHVSPEQGWPVLDAFLQETNRKLTIAMYDFGAPHIIDAIAKRLEAQSAQLQLVMQYGASVGTGTKAGDSDDADTVRTLKGVLGDDFEMQWANVGQTGSLWASAYHIKVAVRDSSAFWLSSGNWQSSNQAPDAPPADQASAKALLTNYNREWHVVIDNPTLAGIFESYIQYDFAQSSGFVPKGAELAYELLPPLDPDPREASAEIRTFDPLEIDREVDVQPVLTPDNYVQVVLPLIEGAKSRIYLQNQYINESLDPRAEQTYIQLLKAIARKQREGLDVRIILRAENGVEARHIEFMKTHGIDMGRVRWRNRTHTKGIIVDSARVLLGSHNWSYDGTVLNRDASLLFYDVEIARYLESIFIYDWESWSRSTVYVRPGKPKVQEIASPEELAELKAAVYQGEIRARRLFHPDD
ncbi:hypothetical protein EAG14_10335 [Acidovorax sp. 1608163]|nr:hypothetical protein EAG14_10335 [Acidovorax sp. 1608163]